MLSIGRYIVHFKFAHAKCKYIGPKERAYLGTKLSTSVSVMRSLLCLLYILPSEGPLMVDLVYTL